TTDECGDDRAQLTQQLAKTVDAMLEASAADAEVLIENLPSTCWFFGGSWRAQIMTSGTELAAFCIQQGIGATLDLCHLHLTPHDVEAEILAALPHVRHLHYSDARWKDAAGKDVSQEGLQIGEGDMPLERYFAHLETLAESKKERIYAVPEVWFGHENDGAAFPLAWARLRERLGAPVGAR